MAKYKKMTNAEVISAVKSNIDEGVGFWDSSLSKERQRVLNYFNAALPLPANAANSKYVSMDVYDTVESMKAALLETFSSGYNIVEFTPENEDDTRAARIASLYTDYVVFRQNNGYKIFSDIITDGLLARNGVAKVYWDRDIVDQEETFKDTLPQDMDALIAKDGVTLKSHTVDPMTGTVSGTISRKVDRSQVRIDAIPPEEFMISSRAKSEKNQFMAHRLTKTVSELLKMGVSQAEIDDLPSSTNIESQTEENARLQGLSNSLVSMRKEYQDQVREIRVHECYLELDIEGTGVAKLHKIVVAGDIMIGEPEQVDKVPFLFFVPLPVPHSFFGSNFASKVIPIQNARSILVRGILDHTVITNNPKTIVVKGALVNPKEMIENRVGGVVNVTRPDGIMPYPQAGLNPFVFQTIGLLDADKEDTTGISKLSQGLNKDAVSQQNSEGLVENLVGLSQQRQKIIARNFANTFLIPLYLEVYRLVLENEQKKKIVDLAGDWVEVDVETWIERKDVFSSLKLGYGEQAKEAGKLMQFHTMMKSDPSMVAMYPPQKQYNVLRAMIEKEGVKNVSDYIVKPGTPEWQPPPPDPKGQAEVALLAAQAEATKLKAETAAQKAQHDAQLKDMKAELDKKSTMLDMLQHQREQERKDFETKSRASVAQQELDILKQAKPDTVKQANIVSPN